ncbi:MAG: PBP1A family penicillin-binding protein [Verrucomicrobia bacterium]|nr:PBP1A family penicillin-binding protein [Verrucomicrobiota bacterium]
MKTSNVRPRRPKRRLWVRLLLAALALSLLGPLAVGAVYYVRSLEFDLGDVAAMPQRATVFDMDAKPYARLYGENRLIVPLKDISPKFVQALLAREDARFYSHWGVDPVGILRAAYNNLTRSRKEGASTLTQQLARNSLPLGGRTLDRKLLEACIALRIERAYTKDQILTHYINRIYYGAGLYGIEAASLSYFGKHAKDLELSEAAVMAGIIRSPNRFSPLKNPAGAEGNRNDVLQRMLALGKISPAEAEAARKEKVATTGKARVSFQQENYAMDAIKRDLDTILESDQQEDGGLQIYSTIDPELQGLASKALEETLAKIEAQPGWEHPRRASWKKAEDGSEQPTEYLQGAVVIIENRTGAIRALVGGRDFAQSKYNRAILARRQVGSSFKSFLFAAAFQRGLLPGMLISDDPIEPGSLKDGNGMPSNWSPANSDEKYNGLLPAADGLIRSRNTMSVRLGEMLGLPEVMKLATAAGLTRDVPASPTIYLGAFEATLKDLTAAYTAFPNGGVRRQPYLIERIDDAEGSTVYRAARQERPMFSEGANWLTSTTLEKVLVNGSAARARSELGFKLAAAGKTGTTNDFRDAWFVGYTSSLTVGVWVGLDKPTTIMRKGYGATLALPVWTSILNKANKDRYPAVAFKPTEALRKVRVCSISNKLATAGCDMAAKSYEIDLPVSVIPKEACGTHADAVPVARAIPVQPGSGGAEPGVEGEVPVQRAIPVNPPAGGQGDRLDQRVGRTLRKFFGGGSPPPPTPAPEAPR